MSESEQQVLAVFERISAQQITLANGQTRLAGTLIELVAELRKPAETNTLNELRNLLKPLVDSLQALSRKLPEPPSASKTM